MTRGDKFWILNSIGDVFHLYSKSNTIPITNFFHLHEDCFDDNKIKSLENYKKRIFELEEEKELYTRIMKDLLDAVNLYIKAKELFNQGKPAILPKTKKDYRTFSLEKREKLKFETTIFPDGKRTTDKLILDNYQVLKTIDIDDTEKFVEMIMLWNTYDGIVAENKIMEFLKEKIPEIDWEFASEEEDKAGIDIKGKIEGFDTTIFIQVTASASVRRGKGDVDPEKIITIYYGKENDKIIISPEGFQDAWVPFFLKIYCDIKKIDFVEYLKNRKIK